MSDTRTGEPADVLEDCVGTGLSKTLRASADSLPEATPVDPGQRRQCGAVTPDGYRQPTFTPDYYLG